MGCNVCVIALTVLLGLAGLAHSSSPCPGSFGRLVSCKDDWNRLPTLPRETSTPTWPRKPPRARLHTRVLSHERTCRPAALTRGAQIFHIIIEVCFKRERKRGDEANNSSARRKNLASRAVFAASSEESPTSHHCGNSVRE